MISIDPKREWDFCYLGIAKGNLAERRGLLLRGELVGRYFLKEDINVGIELSDGMYRAFLLPENFGLATFGNTDAEALGALRREIACFLETGHSDSVTYNPQILNEFLESVSIKVDRAKLGRVHCLLRCFYDILSKKHRMDV
jgi:hypothetical protein